MTGRRSGIPCGATLSIEAVMKQYSTAEPLAAPERSLSSPLTS